MKAIVKPSLHSQTGHQKLGTALGYGASDGTLVAAPGGLAKETMKRTSRSCSVDPVYNWSLRMTAHVTAPITSESCSTGETTSASMCPGLRPHMTMSYPLLHDKCRLCFRTQSIISPPTLEHTLIALYSALG
jgi:hypothetical protein